MDGQQVEDAVDQELLRLVDDIVADNAEDGVPEAPAGAQQGDPSGQQQLRGSGPTLPPRNQLPPPPSRPEAVHPNQPPSEAFLLLADKVRSARGEFEAARMRAYDHVNMDAPVVTMRRNSPKERAERQYNVKLWAPDCEQCNGKFVILKHPVYIELFIALPIMCTHKKQVKNVSVESEADSTVVSLPETWERVMSDFASDSTGASISGAKLDRDLVRVAGKGKVAAEHIKQLYAMALAGRYNLDTHPQLEPQELARLLALTEKATEEAVVDLGLVRNTLYGPPPDAS